MDAPETRKVYLKQDKGPIQQNIPSFSVKPQRIDIKTDPAHFLIDNQHLATIIQDTRTSPN